MNDNKLLRTNPEEVARQVARKGYQLDVKALQELETNRKALQVKTEDLKAKRNAHAKKVGMAKAKGEDISALLKEAEELGAGLSANEAALEEIQKKWDAIAACIPNMPHPSVPDGLEEAKNILVRKWSEPTKFDFQPKDHAALGEALGMMDFETAIKLSGSRFVVMYDAFVRLHRALIQLMLDTHTLEHGYLNVYVPYLVNSASAYGTGNLPKFAEDLFRVAGDKDLWLIPTAEMPVTNIVRDCILDADELPKKFVCHTPCFRSEVGSAGRDTTGMIRQHQFEKVELVQIVKPETSYQMLEELTGHAEKILQKLELPYQVVEHCAGDLSASAAKGYDLEVWLPGQNRYREISSCSNFEAYQARRMQARYRHPETGKIELVHTLNGSGLAVGRTLIAVIENYQDKDGNIHIPKVLQSYMGGETIIRKMK